MTNYERIKQMSVKEMASLIDIITSICVDKEETNSCKYCPIYECTKIEGCDIDIIMDWLESEVDEMPTADVTPIRHGHWVAEYDCGYTTPHCSECGEIALTKEETSYDYVYSSYCPRCGAKMDEKECNSK